jgi:hypothetical protein
LTPADNQKAGNVTSQGLKLVATYMSTTNPKNGKTFTNSGGMRYIHQQKTAKVSAQDLAKFSVGRNPNGVLATVYKIANAVPGSSKACKFVNNKIVSFGGLAVGGVAAFFTGGGEALAKGALQLPLVIGEQVAIDIGTSILVRNATGMIMTGGERNGELVGDAAASGWGSMSGMNAGVNALRPATKPEAAALSNEVAADNQYALAHQSLFDRYLSLSNTDSLATSVALQLAPVSANPVGYIGSSVGRLPQMFGSALSSLSPFAAKVSAADDPTKQCDDDKLIKKHNLATDQFCNITMAHDPDLDQDETEQILLQNKLINDQGDPTDEKIPGLKDYTFNQFIKDCQSGRTGILYADPSVDADAYKNGEIDPESKVKGTDVNPCVDPGPNLPGDSVGVLERLTAWNGYLDDQGNFLQVMNDDYGDAGGAQTGGTTCDKAPSDPDDAAFIKALVACIHPTPEGYKALQIDRSKMGTFNGTVTNGVNKPEFMVWHWTGDEYGSDVDKFLAGIKSQSPGHCCSVQYFVSKDNKVYQFIEDKGYADQAGKGNNQRSEGIEIEAKDLHAYTPKEWEQVIYLTLNKLHALNLPITRDSVKGHSEIEPGKTDPPKALVDAMFPLVQKLDEQVSGGH